jgi:hypothetical protein
MHPYGGRTERAVDWQLGWLGGHLLLRDFWPYGIIFINVCVVVTVAIADTVGLMG